MRIFNLDNLYSIACNTANTRNGFKHVATLHKNGYEVSKTKVCYINRTWERFTYETVLNKMIKLYFTDEELKKYLTVISLLN